MRRSGIHRRTIAIGAVLTALSLAGVPAALAETDVFKDILRPHGVSRTTAQKDADARACGADSDGNFDNVPVFERCMRAHGWAVASIKPNAEERATGGSFYDDMTGRDRSDAALQKDTRACDPHGQLRPGSPAFARCMASHGWRTAFTLPVPRTYARGPSGSAQAQTDEDNFWEAQRNEDAARQMQQSIDATNAANAATAAANAAAAQQQNEIIQQTCNYSC